MEIHREAVLSRVEELLTHFPIVAMIGPRQVGKTTLARHLGATRETHFFDLEDPADLARLHDPGLAIKPLKGLVIIDEVQLRPELFSLLRPLADRPKTPARFLLLGSASPDLIKGSSQSLAGRIAYVVVDGFNLNEVGTENLDDLWIRGGFPRSFLARNDAASFEWREQFIQTFLQRDIPQFGITIPSNQMRRFWTMMAHYHGHTLNASELGRSLNVSDNTIRNYLDILVSTFVMRELQPWYANVSKRQVKSPKVYLKDTGLLHALLGLRTKVDVEHHPKLGASWESFALNQVIAAHGANPEECFFWGTHAGAELDLLIVRGNQKLGFEFKRTEAPSTNKSMHSALETLELDQLTVVHAGAHTFALTESIHALSIHELF